MRAATGWPAYRWALVAVEVVVAAGAVYGGVGLIADNRIGMLPEWLGATPFTSWMWPGIFLLLVVAGPMTMAAVLELRRSPSAYLASLVAAAAQVGWIVAQWLIMQRFFFLQPVMLGAGLLVGLLAWLTHRAEPHRHRGWFWEAATVVDVDRRGRPHAT